MPVPTADHHPTFFRQSGFLPLQSTMLRKLGVTVPIIPGSLADAIGAPGAPLHRPLRFENPGEIGEQN